MFLEVRRADAWVIDPEALLLLTCTMGRHEPRLFDEVLDWLRENGRFINVMRLKRILRTENFAGEGWPRPVVGRSTLRFLPAESLDAFLASAGFVIDERYGDWDRSLMTPTSREIITVARRATAGA